MKQSIKQCKKCNAEITDKKIKKCPECGVEISKPIYKKWWLWVIIGVVAISVISGGGNSETASSDTGSSGASSANSSISSKKTYEQVDIEVMFDELDENALKAEKNYKNKYVEVTGKIANFDSNGAYISIESTTASEWNIQTVMCYIKNDDQLDFLLNKSKGDTVTIKGKIIRVGELLGYSMNIEEVE